MEKLKVFFTNLNLNPSNQFALRYNVDNVVRLDFNECGSGPTPVNTFLYNNGSWETSSAWSLGHVPKFCERVEIVGSPNFIKNVTINSANAKCQSIHILHGTLNIESGANLEVDVNFEKTTGLGTKGVNVYKSTLINNGNLKVMNVQDSRGIEITDAESQLVNNEIINIKRVEGTSGHGLMNRGLLENNSSITATSLSDDSSITGINNFGDIVNNGMITTEGTISSIQDTSTIFGDGAFTCDNLVVGGLFSPGNSPGKNSSLWRSTT